MAFKLIEAAQSGWRAVNAPTWSRSCALARSSRTANSSNAPTSRPPTRPEERRRLKALRVSKAMTGTSFAGFALLVHLTRIRCCSSCVC